jgi:hypothetical protein
MFPRQDPQKGQKSSRTWTYTKVIPKRGYYGHLAGPVEWVQCHFYYRSIPCYHEMTQGKIECPWCKKAPRIDWVGYVPFWEESGKPMVSAVREYARDKLLSLKTYDPIIVLKGESKFDPVFVTRYAGKDPMVPPRDGSKDPVDIREWLLKLWKEQPLCEWAATLSSDTPVSQPPAAEVNPVRDPMVKSAWDRAASESKKRHRKGPTALGDLLPPLNGKHEG